jgi:hypothetical protein
VERAKPLGEWVIADLRAFRGQYISEVVDVTLPLWSLVDAMYLLRENPKKAPRPNALFVGGPRPRAEPVWPVDFTPAKPTLLVDFEGGNGPYPAPKGRTVHDTSAVEMLLLTDDGQLKAMRVARSDRDLEDAARKEREKNWQEWVQQVNLDTLMLKQQRPQPGMPGGMPGGPGVPSPASPGGGRSSGG